MHGSNEIKQSKGQHPQAEHDVHQNTHVFFFKEHVEQKSFCSLTLAHPLCSKLSIKLFAVQLVCLPFNGVTKRKQNNDVVLLRPYSGHTVIAPLLCCLSM